MHAARNPAPLARTAALIGLGTLAVHQLRYQLAYGEQAGYQLGAQGHGYLSQILPALLATALALVATSLVRAALRRPATRRQGFRRKWVLFGSAIAGIFTLQELIEGIVVAGEHSGGLAAVLAGGGWLAFPLALAAGLACAGADTLLEHLERRLSPTHRRENRHRPPRSLGALVQTHLAPRISPMATGFAIRPPPSLS